MPETVLDNGTLTAVINSRGGELMRLRSNRTGIDYLWHGDAAFWEERAPVLFPIVGRLYNGVYRLDGKEYSLPIHGFARFREFSAETGNNAVTCGLDYDDETLSAYPFRFRLEINHALDGNTLTTAFTIRNRDDKDIFFQIGGHPGLKCPFNPGESFDDYYLEFEGPEYASRLNSSDDGLYFREGTTLFLDGVRMLPLNYGLFANDAVTLTGLASSAVWLKSRKSHNHLVFNFNDFPILAFWTRANAGYLCAEPWFGHGDLWGFSGDFKDKPGVIRLSPDKTFTCAYGISIVE